MPHVLHLPPLFPQTYHSALTDTTGLQLTCGTAVLPLKTIYKGVAPPCPDCTFLFS